MPEMITSLRILLSVFKIMGSKKSLETPSLYRYFLFPAWYPSLVTEMRKTEVFTFSNTNSPASLLRAVKVSVAEISFKLAALILFPVESVIIPLICLPL